MAKTLVVAEKPSVARDLASTLPGSFKQSKDKTHLETQDGSTDNGGYIVTWAVGHLVGLAPPDEYDPKLKKWRFADLPILPEKFKLIPNDERAGKQLRAIHRLMADDQVEQIVNASDAGGGADGHRLRRGGRGRADLRVRVRPRPGAEAGAAPVAVLDDEDGDPRGVQ